MITKRKVFFIIILLPIVSFSGIIVKKSSVECNAKLHLLNESGDSYQISNFSEAFLISTDDLSYPHHVEPTIAMGEENTIFVGWKNAYGNESGGVRVGFSKSLDNGLTWSAPIYMPMFNGQYTGQSDPWMVYHNGVLYYAYLEYSMGGSPYLSQITVAKSVDEGKIWSFSTGTWGSGFADKETMTIGNNGIIYIAYDDIGTEVAVQLTRSINNATTFVEVGEIANSADNPVDHVGPYVTTDNNNNVHVAWTWFTSDDWGDVYFTSSYDQGETFTTPIDINSESENSTFTVSIYGGPERVTLPVIRFDQNDRLFCLWSDLIDSDESFGIFLRYSDDYGVTWSRKYQINPIAEGNQWQPDMDIDSQGRVHITYYDERGDTFRPYYRTLFDINETTDELIISDAIPITSVNTSNIFPRPGDYFTVRVDSSDIPHVVWTDGRDNEMDIYYSHGILNDTETSSLSGWELAILIILPTTGLVVLAVTLYSIILSKKRKKQRNLK
ncbi:MAG: sialidase family protein [Candidatus Heimdallarchaeota archaeon]